MPNQKSIAYKFAKRLALSLNEPIGLSYMAKGSTTAYWDDRFNKLQAIKADQSALYSHNVNITVRYLSSFFVSTFLPKIDDNAFLESIFAPSDGKPDPITVLNENASQEVKDALNIPLQTITAIFMTKGRKDYTYADIGKFLRGSIHIELFPYYLPRDVDEKLNFNSADGYEKYIWVHEIEEKSPPIRHNEEIDSLEYVPVYALKFSYPNMGLHDSEYSAEFVEQGCGYATIAHAISIGKEGVHEILTKANVAIPADNGLTPAMITEVFRYMGLACYILDLCGKPISSSRVSNDKRSSATINGVKRQAYVFVIASGHIYTPKAEHRQMLLNKIKASNAEDTFNFITSGLEKPAYMLETVNQPYEIVIADAIPEVIVDNKNYYIAKSNLYDDYLNYLRKGIIYGAVIKGSFIDAIRINDNTYIYGNTHTLETQEAVTALGIIFTNQGHAQLASQYLNLLQYKMGVVLEKSMFNVKMKETMMSALATASALTKVYAYKRRTNDRCKGVDFYRQYASVALRGGFYYANLLSEFSAVTSTMTFTKDYLYYVETVDDELFMGNGVYDPQLVKCGLDNGVIVWDDVKQRAPIIYSATNDNIVSTYINNVYDLTKDGVAKSLVNMMIGSLTYAGDKSRLSKTLLTTNIIEAQYYLNNEFSDATINPIYLTDTKVLYQVNGYIKTPAVDTAMLVRFAIVQRARAETWKLATAIRKVGGVIMQIKTDAVYWYSSSKVNNPYTVKPVPTFGDVRYEKFEKFEICNDKPSTPYIRTDKLPGPLSDTWRVEVTSSTDYYDPANILKYNRAYIDGPAGTGKTHILNGLFDKMKELNKPIGKVANLNAKSNKVTDLKMTVGKVAFTHVASKLIDGVTLHSFLGIGVGGTISQARLKKIAKMYDAILIDEASMISLCVYKALMQLPETVKLYAFGDFRQLPPVEDDANVTEIYRDTTMFKRLFDYNMIQLNKQCRADPTFAMQCVDMFDGKRGLPDGVIIQAGDVFPMESHLHITRSNDMRRQINAIIMRSRPSKILRDKDAVGYDEFPVIYVKCPVIANDTKKGYHNNQRFRIVKIADNYITLSGGLELRPKQFYRDFRPSYAITAYKSQGRTLNIPYMVWETAEMSKYSKYTVLTRTTDPSLVTIVTGGVSTVDNTPTLADSCKIDAEPITNPIQTIQYYKWGDSLCNKTWFPSVQMAEEDPFTYCKNVLIGRDIMYEGADKPSRQFTYFDSHASFWDYYDKVHQNKRHMHEMLHHDTTRCLFIDYDKKISGWYNDAGVKHITESMETVLMHTMKRAFMSTFKLELEYKDIKVVNNSRPGKLSAHAFVTSHVGDSDTNKLFAEAVKQELVQMSHKLMGADGVDLQVYGALKSLRIAGSAKLGYDLYPKKMERFMASSYDIKKVVHVGAVYEQKAVIDNDKEMPADLKPLIDNNEAFKAFRFRDMYGDIGRFYRQASDHCDICNRIHDTDNTMLVIKKGESWMRGCWKGGMSRLIKI